MHYSGQGAGFFGIGMLLDLAGDDHYTLWSDGQGFGGVAGVGVLADRTGDDAYLAVPDPKVTGRPSYHSEEKIAVSDAQGCGMGRRGDGADGHSWAGGIGALLDAEGNDRYTIGNWGQGCGYWFGTGLLWDGAGNDEYQANGWASASGAHFCIGAVVDEAGDDLHTVAQNWGPAFGHDFTVAILFDAAGNDRYECGGDGIGHSINRSVVLCLDGAGDDRYAFKTPDKTGERQRQGPGNGDVRCALPRPIRRRPSTGPSRRRSGCSSTPAARIDTRRGQRTTSPGPMGPIATTRARETTGSSSIDPRARSTWIDPKEGSDADGGPRLTVS